MDDFYKLRDSLEGLDVNEAARKLQDLKINPQLATELLNSANNANLLRGSAEEIADGIKNVGNSTTFIDDIGLAFEGLIAKIAPIAPALFGIATTIAVLYVVYKSAHQFADALEDAKESLSAYTDTKSEVESLNSELDSTKSKIEELESKDSLTLVEEKELAILKEETAELQRQIDLKEKQAETERKAAYQDAATVLGLRETDDLTQGRNVYNSTTEQNEVEYKDTDIITATRNEIEVLEELKKKRAELNEEYNNANISQARKSEINSQIDSIDKEIVKYEEAVSSQISTLDSIKDAFKESDTDIYNTITKLIDAYANVDLSPVEKNLSKIESFFDGSTTKNALKEQIMDAVESGEDAADVMRSLGVNLEDAGLQASYVNQYFQDMKSSAHELAKSVNEIDGSFESVKKSFESVNPGETWTSMADYIKQAKELYEGGLIGTDDFKSVVEWLSPDSTFSQKENYKYDADAYVKAWKNAQDIVKRYFDSENPLESMTNFANDLSQKGLAIKDGNEFSWTFQSSAEAAKALGLSVEATESIMKSLVDYGAEFDQVTWSGENLTRYESALESIKQTYESMGDGDTKDRLGKLIDNWDSELARYQDDLSTLTEDQVVHIEFKYDLAQLDAEIQKLELTRSNEGATVEGNRDVLVAKQVRREQSEKFLLEEKGMVIPVEYRVADTAIANLQTQLNNETDENVKLELQAEIENLTDLQNEMLDAFDSSGLSWDEFIKTSDFNNFTRDIENVKEKVEELTGEEITVDIKANDKASSAIDDIEKRELISKECVLMASDEATKVIELWNQLSPEPKFAEMTAKDQATYVIEMWNSMTPEQKEAYLKGEMTITDNLTGKVISAKSELDSVPNVINPEINVSSDAGVVVSNAERLLNRLDGKTVHTYVYTHNKNVAKANGTAHASGTAYAGGRLGDKSWLKPSWRTKKGEVALTGERATELVVDPSTDSWWTVGDNGAEFTYIPPGAIVFNGQQTKDLLTKGHTNSRGRARASGTALSNGWNLGSVSNGGTSTNSPKETTSGNTTKKTTKQIESALEAIDKWVDWVAIRLSRLGRLSENAESAIDRATTLSKKLKETNDAINAVNKERTANDAGADRYLKAANSVAKKTGLSKSIINKIKNGTIDIQSYSENTQKAIQQYQNYYEQYLECADKVKELEDKAKELAISRLDIVQEHYDAARSLHDSMVELNESRIDYREAKGLSNVGEAYKKIIESSLSELQADYNTAVAERNKYRNEFNSLVSKGTLVVGTAEYNEAKAELNKLNAAINEASIAVMEHKDKLREIEYTKLQDAIDGFARTVGNIENQINLSEARNGKADESLYQKQIDTNTALLEEYRSLRNKKLVELSDYEVGSEKYRELAEEIADIDSEAYDLLITNEELKDSIYELRFDSLEESAEALKDIRGELNSFRDFLNEEAFFDNETGALTAEGATGIALLEQGIISAKQEIAEYREGLEKLQATYDSGLISQEEFNEKNAEYRNGITDAISDVKEYSDALTDLYFSQLNKENDILKEVIESRKEALERKQEYYDYDKNIRNQTKDLNALRAQAAALQGVNDDASKAELKRLQQQIADAEESLADTKRQHDTEMQKAGYDQLSEDLDSVLEDTELEIKSNAEKQLAIVQEMLDQKVAMYSSAYDKINSIISKTGFVGSTDFSKFLENLKTKESASTSSSTATKNPSDYTASGTTQNIGTNNIIDENTQAIIEFLEEELADPDAVSIVTLPGGKKISLSTASIKSSILGHLSSNGIPSYGTGSKYIPEEKLAWTQDGGSEIITLPDGSVLTKLPKGSGVIPHSLTENLWNLASSADDILANNIGSSVGNGLNYINSVVNNGGNTYNFNYDVSLQGIPKEDVLPKLDEILKQSYRYTTQQMTKDAHKAGIKNRR